MEEAVNVEVYRLGIVHLETAYLAPCRSDFEVAWIVLVEENLQVLLFPVLSLLVIPSVEAPEHWMSFYLQRRKSL